MEQIIVGLVVILAVFVAGVMLHNRIKKTVNDAVETMKAHNQQHIQALGAAVTDIKAAAASVRKGA